MATPQDSPTEAGDTEASPPDTLTIRHSVTNDSGDHKDGTGHFVPDGGSKEISIEASVTFGTSTLISVMLSFMTALISICSSAQPSPEGLLAINSGGMWRIKHRRVSLVAYL